MAELMRDIKRKHPGPRMSECWVRRDKLSHIHTARAGEPSLDTMHTILSHIPTSHHKQGTSQPNTPRYLHRAQHCLNLIGLYSNVEETQINDSSYLNEVVKMKLVMVRPGRPPPVGRYRLFQTLLGTLNYH